METREMLAVPPQTALDQRQTRRSARPELVRQLALGGKVAETLRGCPIPMHRSTVYQLLKRVECEGEQAFVERRYGHPVKLGFAHSWNQNLE